MKPLFLVASLLLSLMAYGQPDIRVEVSADTIELGKTVEVKYTIHNGKGKLKLPSLDSLPVISGPNSSSSFLYQNGEQNHSHSYSFVLLGLEEGCLKIPKATYITGEDELLIEPLEIIVVSAMNKSNVASNKSKKEIAKSKREKRIY